MRMGCRLTNFMYMISDSWPPIIEGYGDSVIHLWPLLCVAMSLVMLATAVSTSNPQWITACSVYAALNTFGYWIVVRHYYPGTIKEIFELCMAELVVLAKEWHTTYPVVNLVIYVLLFAVIMTFDVCLISLMV